MGNDSVLFKNINNETILAIIRPNGTVEYHDEEGMPLVRDDLKPFFLPDFKTAVISKLKNDGWERIPAYYGVGKR